jgi:hypothetical protein
MVTIEHLERINSKAFIKEEGVEEWTYFMQELSHLIDRYSLDTTFDISADLLAEYIFGSLVTLANIKLRDKEIV